MTNTQYYTLIAVPLIGIVVNAVLFTRLLRRLDRLIDKAGTMWK